MRPFDIEKAPTCGRFWRLRRAGSTATAVLLMVCVLVVQSREAAMVHVRCAEHGQLMHVRTAGADHIATAPVGTAIVVLPGGSATTDHDHCALIGAKHCVQLAIAVPVSSIVFAIGPRMSPDPVPHTARATFRIAPKNSPPA
jgi:hypothetical protein